MIETKKLDAKLFKSIDARIRRESGGRTGVLELYLNLLPFLVEREPLNPVGLINELIDPPETLEAMQKSFDAYVNFYNALIYSFEEISRGKTPRYLINNLLKCLPEAIGDRELEKEWIPMTVGPVDTFLEAFDIDPVHVIRQPELLTERFNELSEITDTLHYILMITDLFYAGEQTRRKLMKEFETPRKLVEFLLVTVVVAMPDLIAARRNAAPGKGIQIDSTGPATDFDGVSRNDPCPCGSGKKYKKCCMKQRKDPMSVLTPPMILGKKALSRAEVKEYYRLFNRLMTFVQHDYAQTHGIRPRNTIFTRHGDGSYSCDPELLENREIVAIREHLVKNRGFIDAMLAQEGSSLTPQERETIAAWKAMVYDNMIIMQRHREKSMLAWHLKTNHVLLVYGLYDDPGEIVPGFPHFAKLLLLPYKGRIIYDGLMLGNNIEYGHNMLQELTRDYQTALKEHGVTMEIPAIR